MCQKDGIEDPTSRFTTPGVGGERPEPGSEGLPSSRPVPRSQGTRRGKAPLGCDPKSGRAEGPSSSFLDSYKNNRNRFCGRWSVAGEIEQEGKKYRHVARLGCKCWGCEVCGPKRARKLRYGIIKAARDRKLTRFLTLTLDPRYCEAKDSAVYVRKCWGKLRTYIKRRYGQPIVFISVTEYQRNGYAHLHVLVDRYIPQPWIQTAWQAVGGGRFVNIKQVDVHRIAPYLSKYLTKDLFLTNFPPGTRRYSTSRAIKLFERHTQGSWKLIRRHIDELLRRQGGVVVDACTDEDGVLQWYRLEPTVRR